MSKIWVGLVVVGAVTACKEVSDPPSVVVAHAPRTEETAKLSRGTSALLTRKGAELLEDADATLAALSQAEAAWLKRNNYPSQHELEVLGSLDIKVLEASMRNNRDGKAAALVGLRRLRDGDLPGAMSALARGAERGSLYARQELALVQLMAASGLPREKLHEATDQPSLSLFVAHLKVAEILGDHRATASVTRYASNLEWASQAESVLAQVVELMRQHSADAARRGVRATGPDLRPNREAWASIQQNPDQFVRLYPRE